ncbi:MAG: aldolase catalytic domain-containing protein [Bacteroidales bacterium]|jgi:4-hydroxy 2-oxovalerate aldolase|nr:aldolase catalytic domain-containing protein [Bacteroidales bacterium]
MYNISLLDCTLRDGGYMNDWNFGQNTLINVFERITSSGIDFIEIGFLDDRRQFDINRSIMPDTASVEKIYGGLDRKNTLVVGMIDYGTCDIKNIQPQNESFLDGIRVIFKKHIMNEALDFCAQLKQLGYKVFTQAVSITSYDDEELLRLIDIVNKVKPYAVSIVDTYGLLHKNRLFHYYEVMNEHLDLEIGIGYHSHNNFQLGYANCIELANKHTTSLNTPLDYMELANKHTRQVLRMLTQQKFDSIEPAKEHKKQERMLLLDGSVFGMGKGAGNTPTELLAMYMNDNFGAQYDISQILEAADINILDIFKRTPWGYQLKYFLAASNDCHPNYVSFLIDKQTLSIKQVNEVLHKIDEPRKLLYDKNHIEELYADYQKYSCADENDYANIIELLGGKDVLVIGPGATVKTEEEKIKNYIAENSPIVLSINFIPEDFDVKYLFLTNSKRYVRGASIIHKRENEVKIIATSNVTRAAGKFDFNLDYEKLIDRSAVFMDNSLLMLLRVFVKVKVRNVALAGFDGYSSDRETNYYSSEMEYQQAKQKGNEINKDVSKFLSSIKDNLSFKFITSTLYKL